MEEKFHQYIQCKKQELERCEKQLAKHQPGSIHFNLLQDQFFRISETITTELNRLKNPFRFVRAYIYYKGTNHHVEYASHEPEFDDIARIIVLNHYTRKDHNHLSISFSENPRKEYVVEIDPDHPPDLEYYQTWLFSKSEPFDIECPIIDGFIRRKAQYVFPAAQDPDEDYRYDEADIVFSR